MWKDYHHYAWARWVKGRTSLGINDKSFQNLEETKVPSVQHFHFSSVNKLWSLYPTTMTHIHFLPKASSLLETKICEEGVKSSLTLLRWDTISWDYTSWHEWKKRKATKKEAGIKARQETSFYRNLWQKNATFYCLVLPSVIKFAKHIWPEFTSWAGCLRVYGENPLIYRTSAHAHKCTTDRQLVVGDSTGC